MSFGFGPPQGGRRGGTYDEFSAWDQRGTGSDGQLKLYVPTGVLYSYDATVSDWIRKDVKDYLDTFTTRVVNARVNGDEADDTAVIANGFDTVVDPISYNQSGWLKFNPTTAAELARLEYTGSASEFEGRGAFFSGEVKFFTAGGAHAHTAVLDFQDNVRNGLFSFVGVSGTGNVAFTNNVNSSVGYDESGVVVSYDETIYHFAVLYYQMDYAIAWIDHSEHPTAFQGNESGAPSGEFLVIGDQRADAIGAVFAIRNTYVLTYE